MFTLVLYAAIVYTATVVAAGVIITNRDVGWNTGSKWIERTEWYAWKLLGISSFWPIVLIYLCLRILLRVLYSGLHALSIPILATMASLAIVQRARERATQDKKRPKLRVSRNVLALREFKKIETEEQNHRDQLLALAARKEELQSLVSGDYREQAEEPETEPEIDEPKNTRAVSSGRDAS